MFKIKLMVGLAALLTALVVTAAPAMAEFESTNGQTQGKIKTFPEVTTFESVAGGAKIECKSASGEPSGMWQIQVKTQTLQGKYFYQAASKKGPHEGLKIEKWGHCVGPTSLEAKVKCSLQVEIGSQNGNPLSSGNGTGSVAPTSTQTGATGCEVFLGTAENSCTVKVDPNGNRELNKVGLINGGQSEVEIGSEVKGITSTIQESKELCKTLLIKGGQGTGAFITKNNLITLGQKLV